MRYTNSLLTYFNPITVEMFHLCTFQSTSVLCQCTSVLYHKFFDVLPAATALVLV